MPPLHAPVTVSTLADHDTTFVHHGTLHREVFLILRDHALRPHGPAAVRTPRGQRRVMRGIDLTRPRAMRLPAIGGARFAPRPLGLGFRQATRERRRLTIRAPTRHLEFLSQPLVVAAQPLAFVLRPHQILAEAFDLACLIVDDLLGVSRRRRILRAPRHPSGMPDSRAEYKKEMRIRALTR